MWDGHTTNLFVKCKSSPWFKRTVFLTLWTLSFLILVIIAGNNGLNTLYNSILDPEQFGLPKNQIGAFSYTRYNPDESLRPVYSIHFSNLLAENNKLGIFKTALHKLVKIRDLRLSFYQYGSSATSITELNPGKSWEITAADLKALIEGFDSFANSKDGWRVDIDLGNVSEVLVNNFNYEVFCDGKLFFAAKSKRATASYKQPGLLTLRGHVIIKTAYGDTLESNSVGWDLQNNHFTVDGTYILNRNGVKIAGKNICVDSQLNQINLQHVELKQKEVGKCFAKLQ